MPPWYPSSDDVIGSRLRSLLLLLLRCFLSRFSSLPRSRSSRLLASRSRWRFSLLRAAAAISSLLPPFSQNMSATCPLERAVPELRRRELSAWESRVIECSLVPLVVERRLRLNRCRLRPSEDPDSNSSLDPFSARTVSRGCDGEDLGWYRECEADGW